MVEQKHHYKDGPIKISFGFWPGTFIIKYYGQKSIKFIQVLVLMCSCPLIRTADDDVTSRFPLLHRLGSNVYIATAPVELRCATAARSADSGRRIMSFAGLVERFSLFPPLCVSSKSAL